MVPQNYRLLRNRVFLENAASKPLTGEKPSFFDILRKSLKCARRASFAIAQIFVAVICWMLKAIEQKAMVDPVSAGFGWRLVAARIFKQSSLKQFSMTALKIFLKVFLKMLKDLQRRSSLRNPVLAKPLNILFNASSEEFQRSRT